MSKSNSNLALMEKLLTHLKNAKLVYLKAADHANHSERKRFFNQQAMLRNRFFQEILSELQNLGIEFDDLIISRFNFDQLLISSIDTLKLPAVEKCLEADKVLLEHYETLLEDSFKKEKFLQHKSSIEVALEQNKVLSFQYQKKNINL